MPAQPSAEGTFAYIETRVPIMAASVARQSQALSFAAPRSGSEPPIERDMKR